MHLNNYWSFLRTIALLLAIVLLAFHPNVNAQAISGDLVGTITDATGAGIPQATVTVTNDGTGVKNTAITDAGGAYRFANLPVGVYTLSATAAGFATSTVKAVQVQLNNTVTQSLALTVGSTATSVEVTAAPPPLDTTTAQLQVTFESREAEDLPVASFSRTAGIAATIQSAAIWNLSLLGAGVASNGGIGQGTGPTVSGQRPENNTFYLDGVSDNNRYSTGPIAVIANDAVAQVSVLQNQFSAEFGGASGGVFNAVVKSGTNQLHGSIYEYFQNKNLNANDSTFAVQGLTSYPRYEGARHESGSHAARRPSQ